MYLLDRQKKILTLLISGNGWITGEKIGSALGITDRTVRNDIRIINEELQEYTDSVIEYITSDFKVIFSLVNVKVIGD